jgi:hypothetical protein
MHIFSRLKIQADHFKMVHKRGVGEVGPLPSVEGFTDYSKPWELNIYWNDRAKNLNIVKKHTYDILRNWLGYSEDTVQKAMKAAKINLMKLPKLTKDFDPPEIWEVEIKMSLK